MKKTTQSKDIKVNLHFRNEGNTLQKIMESNIAAIAAKNLLLNKQSP